LETQMTASAPDDAYAEYASSTMSGLHQRDMR
jgi:hypothetical protein